MNTIVLLPIPHNEEDRIKAINQSQIMFSPEEQEFQELVKLIAHICEVKIALVTIVHSEIQWFKAKIGIEENATSREDAFCRYTIIEHQLLEVNDTLTDERFRENPLVVTPPHIRFYAGYPIVIKGHAFGTLCVLDDQPKQLTAHQREALTQFAIRVTELIASHKAKVELLYN